MCIKMAFKVVFCATALLVNLQVIRGDDSTDKISKVQTNIRVLMTKADTELNQQIQDIMARIMFIRDQEITANKAKLTAATQPEIAPLEQLLAQSRGEHPNNDCLAEFDPNYAQAINEAGNAHFESCVANYPPGGSVNMDISDVQRNLKDVEHKTSDAMKNCHQEDPTEAEKCIVSLEQAFRQELVRLKEDKIKHMKAEATEAEILERLKMEECMREALTNARVKRDTYKDSVQNCITRPPKIDPKVNLALPRE